MAQNNQNSTLTAVPGFRVGQVTDLDAATGCTVILCPPDTVAGVDVRGGAPGTRETDLLRPAHHVQHVNAVCLAGGGAFGLAAADGVMRYLAEREIGYRTASGYIVPIVPAAIVFDLGLGRADIYPDAAMGYAACAAATDAAVEQGTIGSGTGCRVGAALGNAYASKGGIGSAVVDLGGGLLVAALCVVNAVGDILDEHGQIIAGVRLTPERDEFVGALNLFRQMPRPNVEASSVVPDINGGSGENTIIGVVATNAKLTKEQANKVAQMAHDGLARAVNPAHTMYDGDTLFACASGQVEADVNLVGAFAAEMVAQAVRNGVRHATTLHDVRAVTS